MKKFKKKLNSYKNQPLSLVLYLLVNLAALITIGVVVFLVGFILYHGLPNLTMPGLFDWKYTSDNQSMLPAIINTLIMVVLSLLLAVPLGVY